jgi:hypothetical protein
MEEVMKLLEAISEGLPGDHPNRMDARITMLEDAAKSFLSYAKKDKAIKNPPMPETAHGLGGGSMPPRVAGGMPPERGL